VTFQLHSQGKGLYIFSLLSCITNLQQILLKGHASPATVRDRPGWE